VSAQIPEKLNQRERLRAIALDLVAAFDTEEWSGEVHGYGLALRNAHARLEPIVERFRRLLQEEPQ
jgi:hypothetical protein